MGLKYQAGQEIIPGDRVLFHGEPGEIELVVEPNSTNPDHRWYVQEFGGGVMVREPKHFGRAFIPTDQLPDTGVRFAKRFGLARRHERALLYSLSPGKLD